MRNFLISRLTLGVLLFLLTSSLEKSIFLYEVIESFTAKARLSWYGADKPKLIAGNQWTLTIKLIHRNGLRNHGGFDYEKRLFANKICTTGYVRKSDLNKVLSSSNTSFIKHSLLRPLLWQFRPLLPLAQQGIKIHTNILLRLLWSVTEATVLSYLTQVVQDR